MAYTQAYFTLTWTYSGTPYTKKFRLLAAGADPAGELDLTGTRRDLAGYLNVVRVTFSPKVLEGVVAIHPTEEAGYGSLADLRKAWDRSVTNLTCQRWDDAAPWNAHWSGQWRPIPADNVGAYWYAPIRLEQVS